MAWLIVAGIMVVAISLNIIMEFSSLVTSFRNIADEMKKKNEIDEIRLRLYVLELEKGGVTMYDMKKVYPRLKYD